MGNRIKKLRESKGMSQAELASASGVPVATIESIERGEEIQVLVGMCRKIADVLGVDLEELLLAE